MNEKPPVTEQSADRTIGKVSESRKTKISAGAIALGCIFLVLIMSYNFLNGKQLAKKQEDKFRTGAIIDPYKEQKITIIPPPPNPKNEVAPVETTSHIDPKDLEKLQKLKDAIEAERKRLEALQEKEREKAFMARIKAPPVVDDFSGKTATTAKPVTKAPKIDNMTAVNADISKIDNQDYLLLQGDKIPAVLETAIHSELSGMITAITSDDIYSANGSHLIIPRQSKMIGQYQAITKTGQTRVFIVWNRIVTADGVSINIKSPSVDQIGRSGQGGILDKHFFEKFGASLLLSIVGITVDAQVKNGNVQQQIADNTNNAASNALQDSINIPPTVYVYNGTKLNILVNRDIDFSKVQ